jgi:hypothetical protein
MQNPDHCLGRVQCWVEHGHVWFVPHLGRRVVLVKKGKAMGRRLAGAPGFVG